MNVACEPVSRGDEEKASAALAKIIERVEESGTVLESSPPPPTAWSGARLRDLFGG